jgi:hypothetical protein
MKKQIITIADSREEKAWISGDYAAYVRDQEAIRFAKARAEYLKSNPDVGIIIRNGVEIFYRNIEPYRLGLTQEFFPRDVI